MANKAGKRNTKRGRGRPDKPAHQRRDFARMTVGFSEAQIARINHLVQLRSRVLTEEVTELTPLFRDAGMRDVERQIRELEARQALAEPALAGSPA